MGTAKKETKDDHDKSCDSQDGKRRPTYTTMKSSPFVSPLACSHLVKLPSVIVMVGLPARGKTYISRKLCRYLNWIGIRTKVFNLGDYRRLICKTYEGNEFFDPDNQQATIVREKCVQLALDDIGSFLEKPEGEVAILDATNTTQERRRKVVDHFTKLHTFRVFFIESICADSEIIEQNIQDVKVNSPDYKNMDKEAARRDFLERIEHYKKQYEPINENVDTDLSFIQVFDAGRRFLVQHITGHIQSRVVYFLMNIHLLQRSIFLTRHGESEYNRLARIGGDSPLSERGLAYAAALAEYFEKANVHDLRVWTSQKIRSVQTANYLRHVASYVEYWKALNELDAGICEGLTYEEIKERYREQFAYRGQAKYTYRYPGGESYEDLNTRLEPVIMELERQENVIVVSHQAVLRCLLGYFLDKDRHELPYLRVPLHTVVQLTPVAYGCNMQVIKFNVDKPDRPKWKIVKKDSPTSRDKSALHVGEPDSN